MAIDPKELRIGSHVEYMGERWEVAYIAPKNKVLYYALFQKNRPLLEVFPLEVNPIPLTPELLTELGFEYRESTYFKHWFKGGFDLEREIDKDTKYFDYDDEIRLEYLHELENLYNMIYTDELIND